MDGKSEYVTNIIFCNNVTVTSPCTYGIYLFVTHIVHTVCVEKK